MSWNDGAKLVQEYFAEQAVKGVGITYVKGELKMNVTVENADGKRVQYKFTGTLERPEWVVVRSPT